MKGVGVRTLPLIALLLTVTTNASASPQSTCRNISPSATAVRLSDLPQEIRQDLKTSYADMADPTLPLRQTDSPTERETKYATSRFSHAVLLKGEWFVHYELTYGGQRTLGYFRSSDGRYARAPWHYFGGPFCETLRAILNGVGTPGGANF
jgi:hypothetical protein